MTAPAAPLAETASPSTVARWAVAVAGFCSMLNLYAPQAILPKLAAAFQATPVAVAATISATTLAVALVAPFAGAVADLVGRKRVIVWALVALAVPTVLSALSVTLEQLILTRFLQGVFMPAVFAATLAYVGEEWDRREVGRAMSLYIAATVAGGFAGRFIGGLAADFADWHGTFYVLAAVNLGGALLIARLLPEPRRFLPASGLRQSVGAILTHLKNKRLLAVYLVGFNVLFANVTIFTYVNFHLAEAPYSLGATALGAVFCVYLVGMVITPFAGRLIDRLGQRRLLLSALAVTITGILLTLLTPLWVIVAGLAVFCTGVFACQSASTSYVGLVAGANRSSAAGLYLTFYYAGGGIGAVLPGLAWAWGGWPACTALAIAIQLVVGAIAYALWD